MGEVRWGPPAGALRFGLREPSGELEAGGTVALELLVRNQGGAPVRVFGFQQSYPRTLRVSPPKAHRPWIRVSFGDVNVLHGPDAFTTLGPGEEASTFLDLSFAFDRRGAGRWPVAFAYDAVRAGGRVVPWSAPSGEAPRTEIVELIVTAPRALAVAGIDAAAEAELDAALLGNAPDLIARLRRYGDGGVAFAARRVARVLGPGAESTVGWRAFDALARLGDGAEEALADARTGMPHADAALRYADEWLKHRRGAEPSAAHLPFVTRLDALIRQPDQRGNFLLSWTSVDSPIHGWKRVQILGNGERTVASRAPGDVTSHTRRAVLGAVRMRALLESLRACAVWLLRPLRERALPDEPRPELEVQLALGVPFSRTVRLWNGEWRLGPSAPLADLLDQLGEEATPSVPPSMPPRG